MKPLARFIMRGYSPATLIATVAGMLSLLVPVVGVLGAAAVGLVTLRQGVRAGAWVVLGATLASSAIAWLALGNPWIGLGLLVLFWGPLWALGGVLRLSRSLNLTVQLAGFAGLLLVLALYLALGDPVAYWQTLVEPLSRALVEGAALDAESGRVLTERLSRWMTGAFAGAWVLQALLALFIARAWQSQLYYPGGFSAEFRALRLWPAVGGLFVVLLVWGGLTQGLGLSLAPVLGVILLFQGLAVVHGLRESLGAHPGWLVALYGLWLLLIPQMTALLILLGLIDLWADLRARVARSRLKDGKPQP